MIPSGVTSTSSPVFRTYLPNCPSATVSRTRFVRISCRLVCTKLAVLMIRLFRLSISYPARATWSSGTPASSAAFTRIFCITIRSLSVRSLFPIACRFTFRSSASRTR